MQIKIQTEKVVNKDGIACRRIISIEGVIEYHKLPEEYTSGYHFRSAHGNNIDFGYRPDGGSRDMEVGGTYTETHFQRSIESMKECGQRLHQINQRIAELKKTWNGEETFII